MLRFVLCRTVCNFDKEKMKKNAALIYGWRFSFMIHHLVFTLAFCKNCNCSGLCVRWIGNAPACSRQQCHHSKLTKNPKQPVRTTMTTATKETKKEMEPTKEKGRNRFAFHVNSWIGNSTESAHVSTTFISCVSLRSRCLVCWTIVAISNSIVQMHFFFDSQKIICPSSCIHIRLSQVFSTCWVATSRILGGRHIKKGHTNNDDAVAHMWRYCNDNSVE